MKVPAPIRRQLYDVGVELETLCYHGGLCKVRTFAEILAAVSLAGDISLAAAICASDRVSSHEKYGRNK